MKKDIIFVIGAAGRIGKEIINYFTKVKKYNIIALDILPIDHWEKLNLNTLDYFKIDITEGENLSKIINKVHDKYGTIKAVVNTSYPKNKNYGMPLEEVSIDHFNEHISLHLGGYYNVMRQFIKYFELQHSGNIVNISSIQGVMSPKFKHYKDSSMNSPIEYTAAKAGIISITKYLAKYLKGKNIRVNSISPGGILDNQPEVFRNAYQDSCTSKGLLDAEDLIGTVEFLLSSRSKFINGQNIIIDDGWSL